MVRMNRAFGGVLAGLLLGGLTIAPGIARSQAPDQRLQQLEQRIAEKQQAAEAHRKQMESIKDPEVLSTEMRRHFQMTEEILALMLERRKMAGATPGTSGSAASPHGVAPAPGAGMQGGQMGGMQGGRMGGMQGGGMEHGMGGHGGRGGMMDKEMGGMRGGSAPGAGMPGTSGSASPSTTPGTPGAEMTMDQMMKRIAEHSAYMETITDGPALQREMLRHQKMLDQMLQLMQ